MNPNDFAKLAYEQGVQDALRDALRDAIQDAGLTKLAEPGLYDRAVDWTAGAIGDIDEYFGSPLAESVRGDVSDHVPIDPANYEWLNRMNRMDEKRFGHRVRPGFGRLGKEIAGEFASPEVYYRRLRRLPRRVARMIDDPYRRLHEANVKKLMEDRRNEPFRWNSGD